MSNWFCFWFYVILIFVFRETIRSEFPIMGTQFSLTGVVSGWKCKFSGQQYFFLISPIRTTYSSWLSSYPSFLRTCMAPVQWMRWLDIQAIYMHNNLYASFSAINKNLFHAWGPHKSTSSLFFTLKLRLFYYCCWPTFFSSSPCYSRDHKRNPT